ncbi:hypothetical protein [Flavobacterium soyangense]|uniref:DUF2231 domain-containing protein n=1 Tax=Flavobacterium soyangense TaxID=2023265 RepID=A0A930UEC8_9FLAO|nr:hypothetical protein [Flavobacterium soyangense]MBF2709214.1 hypothetical protein [Flavobacterium soyangense]
MNDAHLHMVVNHFPIIGTILGLGILITGIILKNNSVKNTAYVLFIVAAIFAAFSMGTGEGAEEMVEDMPSVGKQIIHEHEEMAEKLAIVLYVLGVISLAGLFLSFKKHAKTNLVSYLAVIIGIVAVFFAQQTGTTGGEVRHTEIRPNAVHAIGEKQEKSEDKD